MSIKTIPELFIHTTKKHRNTKLYYEWNNNIVEKSYTGKEIYDITRTYVNGLLKLDKNKNTSIAIVAPNSPIWAMLDYAIIISGNISTGIFHELNSQTIIKRISESGARVVFIQSIDVLGDNIELLCENDVVQHVIIIDPYKVVLPEKCISFEQFLSIDTENHEIEKQAQSIDQNDCAIHIFTSGTLGSPKIAKLSNIND